MQRCSKLAPLPYDGSDSFSKGNLKFPDPGPGWHGNRVITGVLIAIPICQGRVSPVFDTASRLLVVRRQRGREVERKDCVLGVLASDVLARSVIELEVDVLLCAAISTPLRLALERGGVRVESHLCGEVEALLAAFCAGNWRRAEFRMPGCGEEHRHGTSSPRGPSARAAHNNRSGSV